MGRCDKIWLSGLSSGIGLWVYSIEMNWWEWLAIGIVIGVVLSLIVKSYILK